MEKVVDLNRWHKEHVKTAQDLQEVFTEIQMRYQTDPFPDYAHRVEKLQKLKQALKAHQTELIQAISEDYGYRSEFDSLICDILPAVNHIHYTLSHLRKWMRPKRRSSGLLLAPSQTTVHFQPLGVVGVIVPWNFPIILSLAPIVTAIAAGNRVMVKLSEHTPKANRVLSDVFACLSDDIQPVEGEAEISALFSQLPFDHILFTGSTAVGRLVAQEAAKNLTPVTLELGGKSPAIVAKDADITSAVDAIMLGKSINAGQICVAPDYVFVPEGKEHSFINTYLKRFDSAFAKRNQQREVTHIVNNGQYQRLQSYLSDARSKGAKIHTIEAEPSTGRQMLPHLVSNVTFDMRLMQEEIFGPILPVVTYRHINEVTSYINSRPRPLALYLMSGSKTLQQQILQQTHSGGVCFNDTLLHLAADDAPFGGIGESGMGQYHGIEGFRTFSKAKTVLTTPQWLPRSRIILRWRNLAQKALSTLFIR